MQELSETTLRLYAITSLFRQEKSADKNNSKFCLGSAFAERFGPTPACSLGVTGV